MFIRLICDCQASKKSIPLTKVVEFVPPPFEPKPEVEAASMMIAAANLPHSPSEIIRDVLGDLEPEGIELVITSIKRRRQQLSNRLMKSN